MREADHRMLQKIVVIVEAIEESLQRIEKRLDALEIQPHEETQS